ncbi:hypothetical protein [Spiroplasma monobiae]|uniref:MOLPALP family lipoprotein n=1 Tax=Spiroplasma monobiae MQ-1 TaxID=1336748 RepID=A0A2K9LUI3_SPISQ|nr:hypothetical protein [Spiroplasma monobiae]AUM62707.1 hypothetical protein SMONO_v1c04580 [Spiroplasma monobiae MQ-1]
MKKLLSLLGAVTMSVSTVGSVAACGGKKNTDKDTQEPSKENNFESAERQDTISKLMSQFAKTLYINQNTLSDKETHFSSKFMFESQVKNKTLKDLGLNDFHSSEGAFEKDKYSDIAKKYFNVSGILSGDVKLSDNVYQDYVIDPSAPNEGIVKTLKETVPTILEMLSDPSSLQGLLGLVVSNPEMIEQIISPEILETLGKVLSEDKLQLLENAFSTDVYKDMDYQTALKSSMIGLSNAVDKMINNRSSDWWLESENKGQIEDNYDEATTTLADNIKKLMDKEAELNVNLEENIDSIAEVIRFVRTLLAYIDQFSYDDMTSGLLTLAKIEEKRTANFSSNSIDVKETFRKLEFMVNNDTTGVSFKNFVGILLATNSTNFVRRQDFTEKVNDGLMDVVQKLLRKQMGQDYIDATFVLGKIYVNSLVRSYVNSGLGNENGGKMIGLVNSLLFGFTSMLPDTIKPFIDAIKNNKDTEKFKNDWMGYLWNNNNDKLGFSIMNILKTPMNKISSKESNFTIKSSDGESRFNQPKPRGDEYITNKSVQELINDFSNSFTKTNKSKIEFNEIGELIKRLRKDDTVKRALENPSKMFEVLGYNEDGSLKEGSVLEQFFKFLEQSKEIVEQSNSVFKQWADKDNEEINALTQEANNLFKNISVSTKKNSINDFEYTVSDGNTVHIFNIKLKYNINKTKLMISEIDLVKKQ